MLIKWMKSIADFFLFKLRAESKEIFHTLEMQKPQIKEESEHLKYFLN